MNSTVKKIIETLRHAYISDAEQWSKNIDGCHEKEADEAVAPILNYIAELEQRLAAAEAKIPDKPLGVFSEGVWVFATTAQTFTAEDLDIAAFVKYRDYMKGGE